MSVSEDVRSLVVDITVEVNGARFTQSLDYSGMIEEGLTPREVAALAVEDVCAGMAATLRGTGTREVPSYVITHHTDIASDALAASAGYRTRVE